MIISASRRTDIPAFYSRWFINRIKEGYCLSVNPYNPKQVTRVSLAPEDVDVFVFWTRNPAPLLKYLPLLDARGYRYYFLYTITGYPRKYETNNPALESSTDAFRKLADKIGPGKVIWRYDPVLISDELDTGFHLRNFKNIASQLEGYTKKVKVSLLTYYRKTERRLAGKGINYYKKKFSLTGNVGDMFAALYETAKENSIVMESCAEEVNLARYGIKPGSCIDVQYINKEFGLNLLPKSDKNQRGKCLCNVSKDIGAPNSCLFGCEYCYSVISQTSAVKNNKRHDPGYPALLPGNK